ncbi:hypothetical protein QL285_072823 [Trifolium repens]|nr:hypothetical protein QL285_072823 [Trifolium repens]
MPCTLDHLSVLHYMFCETAISSIIWWNVVKLKNRASLYECDIITEWININFESELAPSWDQYWAMLCHKIWYWRNILSHDEE